MIFASNERRAGTYAKARYQRGLRKWRAANRLALSAAFGPIVLAGFAVLVVEGHPVSWVAGAIAGLSLGAWIGIRESPPAYIEQWQTGAEGERKTEKALAPLKRHGWHIVHDVPTRSGNYDHIAVGPAGVFLLETKNLRGIVELRNGVPYVSRRHDPATIRHERIRPGTLKGAVTLKNALDRHGVNCAWVQAVVVFWSDFPAGLLEDDHCVFVHGSRLHALLHGRASRLSETEVQAIAAAVEEIASHDCQGRAGYVDSTGR